jgi:hypothetical protein
MKLPPELPISPEEWEKTPLSVQAVVIMLWEENQLLRAQVAQLQKQVGKLESEVARLQERVNKTSQNSSKPPSSDPPQMRKATSPASNNENKKKGGRPRHVGKGRKLKPLDEVSQVVRSLPSLCRDCGNALHGVDTQPERHQVSELPKIVPEIIEYQRHTLTCERCGAKNRAEWPTDMPRGSFGERLQAMIGYLSGRFGISHRDMDELLETVFQVEISLGSVPAQQQRISQALKAPVEAAQQHVQHQAVVNVDETGWHELSDGKWLWVCTTPNVTVFRIFDSQAGVEVERLLGKEYAGIIGSDRYSAYAWIDPLHRQVCWAHLKRDFHALVDRGGESQVIGQMLLARLDQLFGFWHHFRDGTMSRIDLQVDVQPIRTQVEDLLEIGTLLGHRQTRRTCQNILKVKQALWTFIDWEDVEPTNNAAERALRRGVLWRKRSFGTQSKAGSESVERILTVVITLRQQNRNVLDYLTAVCKAAIQGTASPSLVPVV